MDTADADATPSFDHAAWRTGLGTLIGYGLILVVMTVLFFLVPYAIFANVL